MKIKLKIFLLLIPILIFLSNNNYAKVDTTGKNFALHNQGERRKTGYYYISTTNSIKPVAKIVNSNSKGTVENEFQNETGIYSIKNGTGISATNARKKIETYNQYYNLEEYKSLESIYKTGLPKDEVAYNQLAWVLNNICSPDNELSKQALLITAGINPNTFRNYKISNYEPIDIEKDIIESIQQAAIWYFTNSTGEYHPTDELQLYVSTDLNSAINLSEMNIQNNESPVNKLYKYLVNGAIEATQNGYNYTNEVKKSPIIFNKQSARVDTYENNYIIGPYNISVAQENCTLQVSINSGKSDISEIKILGEDLSKELVGETINDKIVSNLGKNFYISVPTTTSASKININVRIDYNTKKLTYWNTTANKVNSSEPIIVVKNESKTNIDSDSKSILKTNFDLALRQFITTVNDVSPEKNREPEYKKTDLKSLADGSATLDNGTTLTKKTKKDGVSASTGDKILFTIRVYNEGQIDGRAEYIAEFLPEGLEFIEDSEINKQYKWVKYENDNKVLLSDYLIETDIPAFNSSPEDEKYKIDYKDIQLECKVKTTTQTTDVSLKAIAEIVSSSNLENIPDRDSNINNLTGEQRTDYNPGTSSEGKGYEDDDDYDEIIVVGKCFDLALKSYISETEDASGNKMEYKREPKVDVSPILAGGITANYYGSKGPVSIEAGTTITYTIRVYNEGQIDGYADEIMHHLPENLDYVNDEFNAQFGWIIDTTDATQRTLKTTALSKENDEDNAIKAFDTSSEKLDYKELKLKCKVRTTAPALKEITSVTEINKTSNSAGLADRDNKSNVSLPSDKDLENYKGNESNKAELSDSNYYYKGQEDDDDFDKVILEKFDFALRCFITKVNGKDVDSREPEVNTSTYGENIEGKVSTSFEYRHNKDEVKLCNNDIVTYKIRVYNEGTQDGYVAQLGNSLPNGLKFDKDNETNKKYKWKMYDESGKETDDADKATYLKTNYLAKQEDGDENLIKSFNTDDELNYKDVEIELKVSKPNSAEERTIKSEAQIIKATDADGGKVSDVDSSPNSWQDGDDDQDEENIYVKFFDLSLKMIVDKVITIEDGYEKISETMQSFDSNDEPVVNVSITNKDLEETIIKYRFKIRITNEGEIPGTASQISDYVPDGLRFNQADNLKWQENNGIVSTDQLKTDILEPGDSRIVYLTLTWVNEERSIGVKKNIAEISAIFNEHNSEDADSIPGNKIYEEDDTSDSQVAITAMAGTTNRYLIVVIIATIVLIVGTGIFLIKKFVL